MSVSNSTSKVQYTLTGVGQALSVPFHFIANGDIKVINTDSVGVDTDFVEGTNYTLTGAGVEAGGTLTMIGGTVGDIVTIKRDIAITQLTDFVSNDSFPASVHETGLDRLTMISQATDETAARSIQFPESEVGSPNNVIPVVSSRKGKLLSFDSSTGAVVANLGVSDIAFDDTPITIAETKTALEAVNVSSVDDKSLGYMRGRNVAYDDGGGVFVLDKSATLGASADNGGTVLVAAGGTNWYWVRLEQPVFNVRWFGAYGDGSNDDSTAVQAAIDAAESIGGTVFLPAGTYLINTGLTLQEEGVVIKGVGRDVTGATTGTILKAGGAIQLLNVCQVEYVLATATDALTVPFDFAINGHIAAIAKDTSGVDTALTEYDGSSGNYTLTGAGVSGGGTLTMIGGTVGDIVTIRVTTAARRATVRDLIFDGNGVGKSGLNIGAAKFRASNVTVRGFVDKGVRITSFSTLLEGCDIFQNTGHGVVYDGGVCNDSRIIGGSISGNSKHGIWVDTRGGNPNAFFFRDVNMESNCSAGSTGTPYAHIYLSGGVEGAHISGCYHESDVDQTGYADQRFVRVGSGAKNVSVASCQYNCSVGDEFDYFIDVEASAYPVLFRDSNYQNIGTAFIDNAVGASGALYCDNVTKYGDVGHQLDLVDYAGSPTTAGQNLTVTPNRAFGGIYKNADQSVTSATMATILFASTKFDGSTLVDGPNNGITVKEEGYYRIDLRVSCYNHTAGEVAKFQVVVDGVSKEVLRLALPAASGLQTGHISALVHCNADDLIIAQAARTTNSFDIYGSQEFTYLSACKESIDSN